MDIFANPSASFADLLLPAATPWEAEALKATFGVKGGTREAAAWAQMRKAVIAPAGEARADLSGDLRSRLSAGPGRRVLRRRRRSGMEPSARAVGSYRRATARESAGHECRRHDATSQIRRPRPEGCAAAWVPDPVAPDRTLFDALRRTRRRSVAQLHRARRRLGRPQRSGVPLSAGDDVVSAAPVRGPAASQHPTPACTRSASRSSRSIPTPQAPWASSTVPG